MKRLTWKTGCLVVALGCAAVYYGYRFSEGEVPLSTLPVAATEEKKWDDLVDIDFPLLWPPTFERPFPPLSNSGRVYSPDGQFYIQLCENGMCMFDSVSHRALGCYSFHDLIIYRWAEDSSGVYVSDYIPGISSILPVGGRDAYISEVKKVLVPCRGSLAGVALLPRLYWEMRCAFPEPYGFVAVWLPLLIVTVLVAVGSWLGLKAILWVWRRAVRPWWYGE
ncbi:MAG: hypothetical protein RMK99_07300 [Anaerolineales bacterium]|nr:hypothetical protein [Anaerolineales bacterium]